MKSSVKKNDQQYSTGKVFHLSLANQSFSEKLQDIEDLRDLRKAKQESQGEKSISLNSVMAELNI